MVKCDDCRHFKHRYTIFFDGHYPELKQILVERKLTERDFTCEGMGCVFLTNTDILDSNLEHKCKNFVRKRRENVELQKNIWRHSPKSFNKYTCVKKLILDRS